MRLLKAKTLKLEEFNGEIPKYAILSHTWGDEEVSFKHMTEAAELETMKGYKKIRFLCEQAQRDSLEYAWCDTCCMSYQTCFHFVSES